MVTGKEKEKTTPEATKKTRSLANYEKASCGLGHGKAAGRKTTPGSGRSRLGASARFREDLTLSSQIWHCARLCVPEKADRGVGERVLRVPPKQ